MVKLVVGLPALVAVIALVGCGESEEQIYERGYEEGYDDGQYDVCEELDRVAPRLKDRLRQCDEF